MRIKREPVLPWINIVPGPIFISGPEAPLIVRYKEYEDQLKRMLGHVAERIAFDQVVDTLLLENPRSGRLIYGTGGFRKLRVSRPDQNKGNRGGARLIYYYSEASNTVFLYTVYAKNVADNLSQAGKVVLRNLVEGMDSYRPNTRRG